jgi:hypothetical protein
METDGQQFADPAFQALDDFVLVGEVRVTVQDVADDPYDLAGRIVADLLEDGQEGFAVAVGHGWSLLRAGFVPTVGHPFMDSGSRLTIR